METVLFGIILFEEYFVLLEHLITHLFPRCGKLSFFLIVLKAAVDQFIK